VSATPQDPQKRAQGVQRMFARIAPRYDLMNRLMTGGMDVRWRVEVIRRARIGAGDHLLDLGAGTGDLARETLRQAPGARVLAADFTVEMMQTGRSHYGKPQDWSGADALHLPFPDQCFDAVVSGFLMRNVVDVPRALAEQYRVLKPGGRLVTLDTTKPRENLLSPFIRFHMRKVIPWLGGLLSGDRSAYTYLPETSENFLPAEDLLARIHEAGFRQAGFRRLNFGTVAIHWAER